MRAEDCVKLDTCQKIEMIRDKDMLDFQYAEAIRGVCAVCDQGESTKETMKEVKKVWGKELWLVNCPSYCGKLLYLDKGGVSSMHYHKVKQETFYALSGQTGLHIAGKDYMLNPASRPKTVYPKQEHQLIGFSDGIIVLEISTHHDDNDVVRLSASKGAKGGVEQQVKI